MFHASDSIYIVVPSTVKSLLKVYLIVLQFVSPLCVEVERTRNSRRMLSYTLYSVQLSESNRSLWMILTKVDYLFQVITPFRSLVLCCESRREMEEWLSALTAASQRKYNEPDHPDCLSGQHHW